MKAITLILPLILMAKQFTIAWWKKINKTSGEPDVARLRISVLFCLRAF